MDKKEKLIEPVPDLEEKAQGLVKGALGGVPFAGGAIGELFDIMYQSGYEKRLQTWRGDVSKRLNSLREEVLKQLEQDEEFQSLLAESTLAVLKNHQEIKIEAIKNLLFNSTTSTVEYDFKKLFINYIDQFTAYHLRTMWMIFENNSLDKSKQLSCNELDEKILKEVFHSDEAFNHVVRKELGLGKGLVDSPYKEIIKYGHKLKIRYLELTDHGKNFMTLIKPE